MGFHELRQLVGDDLFRQSLRTFYKDYRGTRASFGDVRTAFEKTTGRDLARFFDDWVNRTGAADLAVSDVTVSGSGSRYTVTGVVAQRQAGPYDLEVPVVVSTAAGPVIAKVRSKDASTTFSIETTSAPTAVSVDPAFDLFRMLDPRETAPSIGQLFGASEVVAVLPAAEADTWRRVLEAARVGVDGDHARHATSTALGLTFEAARSRLTFEAARSRLTFEAGRAYRCFPESPQVHLRRRLCTSRTT